jgi:hypothetical protein
MLKGFRDIPKELFNVRKKLTQRRKGAKEAREVVESCSILRPLLCAFAPLRETLF